MKAVLQEYGGSGPRVVDVPEPTLQPGGILVRTAVSLLSAGTERTMVELAGESLLGKARQRPDLVRRVVDKARRDGLAATLTAVRDRLDRPVPLGYSSAGTVLEAGTEAGDFRPGDRVACAGAGYASHAEVVAVPRNLAVRLPDGVGFEEAAFATVGAIALQGFRLSGATLGETVAVLGLGLVGQLAAQIARAGGCRVLGMDLDPERCRLAGELGLSAVPTAAELSERCRVVTQGRGADAVLVTAATESSEPVALAGEVARDRATVVVVGAVGMEVPRQPYYEKELSLRVSRSYGPGRYDPTYEERGVDYPPGYVRWTENRNLAAFVELLASGAVVVGPLVTHRYPIAEAERAYALLGKGAPEPSLGILLTYPEAAPAEGRADRATEPAAAVVSPPLPAAAVTRPAGPVRFGVLGAGQFASGVLLPALTKMKDVQLASVCTSSGASAHRAAKKFGFGRTTTREEEVLGDPDIEAVLIATRHHLHAPQVVAALRAGKHVFVEKPLCLTAEELAEIEGVYAGVNRDREEPLLLMVGYNRRFALLTRRLGEFLAPVEEPLVMHYRINAGYVPADHWIHDPRQGGGRLVGEVCHFVDLLSFLAGRPPARATARAAPNRGRYRDDNLVAILEFPDGSLGTITYVASGDRALAKERLEVHGGGRSAVLENFRRLDLFEDGRRSRHRERFTQDKGHAAELRAFVEAVRDGTAEPLPFADSVSTTRVTFELQRALGRRATS